MKISKNIFWISLVISVLTLLVSIYLSFCIKEYKIVLFINNIMQNMFAGTIFVVITSLYEYMENRKNVLQNIAKQIVHLRASFQKLEYFDSRDFVSREEYLDFYKDKNDIIKEAYDIEKNRYLKKQKDSFKQIIENYISIANEDYTMFWDSYRELSFMFDFRNKKRDKIYYELFSYLYDDIISRIREASFHFKEYKNSENGNFCVNKNILSELQKEIFIFEEKDFLEEGLKVEFETDKTRVDICGYGENAITKKIYIYGNKVTKYLEDFYKYILELAYFGNNK